MKKTENDLLFVELKEPSSTRRDILMSTKDVLDVLRRYEEYRAISTAKQEALAELNQVVSSIQSLNRKIKAKMPKAPVSMPKIHEFVREREEKDESITGPQPEMARPKSKLDILQEELQKIESRLSSLE
jgi:septal ring factor EnvC (AmiA/AmiB activator)